MNDIIASVQDIKWSYGDRKLFESLSTTFRSSHFTTIVGPNGSGKTTLLKHLLKILDLPQGTIALLDQDVRGMTQKQMARAISYVPQKGFSDYEFSIADFVTMGRYSHVPRFSLLSQHDIQATQHAMNLTGITHLKDRLVTEISGGEYQRMVIARALAQESKIIALDEPVSHLDVYNQREILTLLKRLVNLSHISVICVLHDLNAAMAFSDRIIMMKNGAIVAEGSPVTVLTPERIKDVYSIDVDVYTHHETGKIALLPAWL
ncbi:MAG: ABC transporter ATP-binding protein [Sphaerochaetaceae bacterium]|jgi:iron complex transport system ATP-binding protein|nr:ABC transporter ATP-binding protein [Sphaerochaetaceae bacterium]NLO60339.1 ABC transporter ATP-binding protein [Spirochaetales bacterium]MDD2405905.1 ABC transporter ATP-binding protein [Sphaerochaetaceae bacterium]MDD3670532.1 ABC transporter ATP-binding protein [Sphaerochaetaceae bacterium]MDD4260069.1 ABC transporter ATP-binding protein [Sphaerochaetaceae bacterium]